MIIHSPRIKEKLKEELKKVNREILIISAFGKIETLAWIDDNLNANVEKTCIVRFRLDDILSGSTDFELYDYCLKNNWKLYSNFALHSKIYCFDKKTYLIGSANLTQSGIGILGNSNIESMVFGSLMMKDYLEIKRLVSSSLLLNDEIIDVFKNQLKNLPSVKKNKKIEWLIEKDFKANEANSKLKIEDLIKSTFPTCLAKEDVEMLNLEGEINEKIILNHFLESKIFFWFFNTLSEKKTLYFGALTQELHQSLSESHPNLKRSEVKFYLSNLIRWIEYFDIDYFTIDKPNHSQRVSIKV